MMPLPVKRARNTLSRLRKKLRKSSGLHFYKKKTPLLKRIFRVCLTVFVAYAFLVAILGLVYRYAPPVSTLMLARWMTFQEVKRETVSLSQVSPNLRLAVISAEDGRFCDHWGIDWKALNQALEEAGEDGPTRGASTLSMQVAKNLFLWPHKSYARKALEMPIALYLDFIWPKSRMLEVYFNISEWGDGIFGAEAASRIYFHKSARNLTRSEAALLAAALPNPIARNPEQPSGYYRGYAWRLLSRMQKGADLSCLRS